MACRAWHWHSVQWLAVLNGAQCRSLTPAACASYKWRQRRTSRALKVEPGCQWHPVEIYSNTAMLVLCECIRITQSWLPQNVAAQLCYCYNVICAMSSTVGSKRGAPSNDQWSALRLRQSGLPDEIALDLSETLTHLVEGDVSRVREGFTALNRLMVGDANRLVGALAAPDLLAVIVSALKKHLTDSAALTAAIRALKSIAQIGQHAVGRADSFSGARSSVALAFHRFLEDKGIALEACSFFDAIGCCAGDNYRTSFDWAVQLDRATGLVANLSRLLQLRVGDLEQARAACSAIRGICFPASLVEKLQEHGGCTALVAALSAHAADEQLADAACCALARWVSPPEPGAHLFIAAGGLPVLFSVLQRHESRAGIAGKVAMMIRYLADVEEAHDGLIAGSVVAALASAASRNIADKDCVFWCMEGLNELIDELGEESEAFDADHHDACHAALQAAVAAGEGHQFVQGTACEVLNALAAHFGGDSALRARAGKLALATVCGSDHPGILFGACRLLKSAAAASSTLARDLSGSGAADALVRVLRGAGNYRHLTAAAVEALLGIATACVPKIGVDADDDEAAEAGRYSPFQAMQQAGVVRALADAYFRFEGDAGVGHPTVDCLLKMALCDNVDRLLLRAHGAGAVAVAAIRASKHEFDPLDRSHDCSAFFLLTRLAAVTENTAALIQGGAVDAIVQAAGWHAGDVVFLGTSVVPLTSVLGDGAAATVRCDVDCVVEMLVAMLEREADGFTSHRWAQAAVSLALSNPAAVATVHTRVRSAVLSALGKCAVSDATATSGLSRAVYVLDFARDHGVAAAGEATAGAASGVNAAVFAASAAAPSTGSATAALLSAPRCDLSQRAQAAVLWAIVHGDESLLQAALARISPKHAVDLGFAVPIAARFGRVWAVDALLTQPSAQSQLEGHVRLAFRLAAAGGHAHALERLLTHWDAQPEEGDSIALWLAAEAGHFTVVQRLLAEPAVDPASSDGLALWLAAENGHVNVVDLLLADPRVDPNAAAGAAVRLAARNGHVAVVARLLEDERVDPDELQGVALADAAAAGHVPVLEALLADPRTSIAVIELFPVNGPGSASSSVPLPRWKAHLLRLPRMLHHCVLPAVTARLARERRSAVHAAGAGAGGDRDDDDDDGGADDHDDASHDEDGRFSCVRFHAADVRGMAAAAWRRRRAAVLAWATDTTD